MKTQITQTGNFGIGVLSSDVALSDGIIITGIVDLPVKHPGYVMVQDNENNWYVIPYTKIVSWRRILRLTRGELPGYAKPIDSPSDVIFGDYEIT